MDKQVVALVAVVAIILTSGMGLFFMQSGGGDRSFQIISNVNTGGSGIYIDRNTGVSEKLDGGLDSKFILENKELGGLVMGTPGVSSIQHTQLQKIAKDSGLDFKKYVEGEKLSEGTLYYIEGLNTYNMIKSDTTIDGGIIWEPLYQMVIQEGSRYRGFASTNYLFGDHVCCVAAADSEWLKNNEDVAVRFLRGYIEGVKFIIDKRNADDLIGIASSFINIKVGDDVKRSIAEAAINNINYKFDDNGKGVLKGLREGIEKLSSELCDMGIDNGLPDAFVNNSFIEKALVLKEDAGNTGNVLNVSVSVIDGDLHHLAAHISKEKGYFKKYGLEVDFKKGSSGVMVADTLLSGDAKIGLLGASPAIVKLAGSM